MSSRKGSAITKIPTILLIVSVYAKSKTRPVLNSTNQHSEGKFCSSSKELNFKKPSIGNLFSKIQFLFYRNLVTSCVTATL